MKCPVCLSNKIKKEAIITRFQPAFQMAQCADCQSYYRTDSPEEDKLYYDKDYYGGKAEYSYIDEREIYEQSMFVWQARLKKIRSFVKSGKFLDVGCSFGGFASAASKYFEAYGIDVSGYAVQEGQKFLSSFSKPMPALEKGELTSANLPGGFSVITMIEVIEHLKNPRKHVEAAYRLLKPGGVFVIQTANMEGRQAVREGWSYHYFLPGHLTCFSATGLKNMLRQAGFTSFREFIPVDFGLLPKLKKMQHGFHTPRDYFKWLKTASYHFRSYLRYRGRPLTSSYVLYAFKEY